MYATDGAEIEVGKKKEKENTEMYCGKQRKNNKDWQAGKSATTLQKLGLSMVRGEQEE
jgi:hypothetical protein